MSQQHPKMAIMKQTEQLKKADFLKQQQWSTTVPK
jgi:hypothetical protein